MNNQPNKLDREAELIKIARKEHGEPTEAEQYMLKQFGKGESADFTIRDDKGDDPAKADQWTEARELRGDFLSWFERYG